MPKLESFGKFLLQTLWVYLQLVYHSSHEIDDNYNDSGTKQKNFLSVSSSQKLS